MIAGHDAGGIMLGYEFISFGTYKNMDFDSVDLLSHFMKVKCESKSTPPLFRKIHESYD